MSVSNIETIQRKDATKKVITRERTYDYLYDPDYTVSSEVDHIRNSFKAYTSKERVLRVPEYGSMFSSLPQYPRFRLRLDPNDPIPTGVERRWRGPCERSREALLQLAGVGQSSPLWLQKEEAPVTGADRWKYFGRPLVPYPLGIFALPREDLLSGVEHVPEQRPPLVSFPVSVSVGVQTDYRESETQTDPYSPEYVLRPGTTPSELMTLASLSWGRGLPAGLAEVEMIERLRAKRAWEQTLPPLDDLGRLDERRRLMEEMEAKEWAFREGEIQKIKEARLDLLTELMRKRDRIQQDYTHDRLMQTKEKLEREKEAKYSKINNDYFRAMRKLHSRHKTEMDKLTHFYKFKDYSALSSRVRPAARKKDEDVSSSFYTDTIEGLTELEAGLSTSTFKSSVKSTQRLMRKKTQNSSEKAIQLYEQYRALRKRDKPEDPLDCVTKIEKPPPPPVTPEVEKPSEEEEEREIAVINLQKFLRGRAIQYELIKDKENHRDLIMDLRTAHALQAEGQEKHEKDNLLKLKREEDQQSRRTERLEASLTKAEDAETECTLDTLSKELVRLQEERRVHALALLAERDRRIREAEESGGRQVEERRRQEEDHIFKQVVQIHKETVDLYLEDIILSTSERVADEQARLEVHQFAQKVNDVACALEESLQSDSIVHELVYSFLIPDVMKKSVQQKVQRQQEKHRLAARSIIQGLSEAPPSSSAQSPAHSPAQSPSRSVNQNSTEETKEPATDTDN